VVSSRVRGGVGPAVSLALVGALALAGCGGAESASPGGSTAEGGQVTVRYTAGAATVTDWDDYVADAKGFYTANGITVDRIDTQTATAATRLLVTGEADIGRGLPPAIQAVEASNGGVSLISTADILRSSSGSSSWASPA
jgi:ABC-type nitrate/sulfonate/bicarbonate transport system substrate-binding protein